MEIHFVVNETMDPLANRYFLPSLPSNFKPVSHRSDVPTSGEHARDGFFDVLSEKIDWILSVIEGRLDNQLMFWSDVDVVFSQGPAIGADIRAEIEALADGKDLLFQREFPEGNDCNTGIQVIRRNTRTLVFYAQVRLMLEFFNRSERACVNRLLGMIDGVEWDCLPLAYSSESNKGLSVESRLYHANCTPVDSQQSKARLLSRALQLWSCREAENGRGPASS